MQRARKTWKTLNKSKLLMTRLNLKDLWGRTPIRLRRYVVDTTVIVVGKLVSSTWPTTCSQNFHDATIVGVDVACGMSKLETFLCAHVYMYRLSETQIGNNRSSPRYTESPQAQRPWASSTTGRKSEWSCFKYDDHQLDRRQRFSRRLHSSQSSGFSYAPIARIARRIPTISTLLSNANSSLSLSYAKLFYARPGTDVCATIRLSIRTPRCHSCY